MRNVFHLLIALLSTVFAADRAMAVDMDDLEVTIRVIESGKDHAADIGHRLELPNPPSQKTEQRQHKENREQNDHKAGINQSREKDEPHGDRGETHDVHSDRSDHHNDVKEDHERAVEQFQNSKEERNLNSESREDLKEMLNGDHGDLTRGDSKGADD